MAPVETKDVVLDPNLRAPTRIVLARASTSIRDEVYQIVKPHGEFEIVGEVTSLSSIHDSAREFHPDILLLCVEAAPGDSMRAIDGVLSASGETKIIAVTGDFSPGDLVRMMKAGMHGYIPGDGLSDHLQIAIKTVLSGKLYFASGTVGSH